MPEEPDTAPSEEDRLVVIAHVLDPQPMDPDLPTVPEHAHEQAEAKPKPSKRHRPLPAPGSLVEAMDRSIEEHRCSQDPRR